MGSTLWVRGRHWARSAWAFRNPEPTDDVANEAARRNAIPGITVTGHAAEFEHSMKNLFQAGKLLLLDMASTFFFLVVYLLTGNITLSVVLGMALGAAQIGWQLARHETRPTRTLRRSATQGTTPG
jgi:hypothetical protein